MSVLELLGSVLTELEKIQAKLDRLLAVGSARQTEKKEKMTDDEVMRFNEEIMAKIHKRKIQPLEIEEEVDMDFSQVTVMNQTEKGLLVVKKGKQQWLAKQFIKDVLEEYVVPNVYDIKLLEVSPTSGKPIGWITKKWEVFEVFKG